MAPIPTAVGFTTRVGTLALLVDDDANTGWAPNATRLTGMTDTFVDTAGFPNVGKSFAYIQFDFGLATRIGLMLIQCEGLFSLGDCMIVASNNPGTTTAQAVQADDVLLGLFSRDRMVSGLVLETLAKDIDIQRRYLRFCFHQTGALMRPEGTDTGTGGSFPNGNYYDVGSGIFEVPSYSGSFITEGWGGGASGGTPGESQDGGDTSAGNDSVFTGIAEGGNKPTTNANANGTPATGGAASGANTSNLTGGSGSLPSNFTAALGLSGKGGNSPNGGTGGAAVDNPGGQYYLQGKDGNGPGGGGSGRNIFTSPAGGTVFKYPGGGAGGYFKDVRTPGSLPPGSHLVWSIGAGGLSPIGNGRGANGRVKFSWT